MSGTQGRAPAAAKATQMFEESFLEAESRRAADFTRYESMLPVRYTKADISYITKATGLVTSTVYDNALMPILGLLGSKNPLARRAEADENIVWILNNIAHQKETANGSPGPWEAEFVACFFHKGRADIEAAVASIADAIGIDGKVGLDDETSARIKSRLQPFIYAISPARSLPIVVAQKQKLLLGPSNANGISSQTLELEQGIGKNREIIDVTSDHSSSNTPPAKSKMYFAGMEGWAVISDIDDTIKITQTSDPIGILQTTFVQPPKPTRDMPQFYKIINEQFSNPVWMYLSASPYNLYPFLNEFITDNYPHGTTILRDASWHTIGGLLSSLTQGVQAYKVSRMKMIHEWLPKRKFICIGDSTQSDPEAYAEIYKKYPGWIKAIYIRKVTDALHMEKKNEPQRFVKAFEGVPAHIWRVFELPDELKDHLEHLAGEHHMGMVGTLKGFFCDHHQALKQDDRHQIPGLKT